MALTRAFKDTLQARILRDGAFRAALLAEGLQALLSGDLAAGKLILRDYIKATGGFEALGRDLDKSPKSLMRMFSESGNPQAGNLLAVIAHLQRRDDIHLVIRHTRKLRRAA